MKKINLLLAILSSIFCFSQNAKVVGWYIQELHYPEITLPSNYSTYDIKINTNNESVKLIENGEQKTASFKNPDVTNFILNSINLPGYSKSDNSDFTLEFNDLGVKHIISVTEKKSYGQGGAKNTYTGIVELSSTIELIVENKKDSIIFQKKYSTKYKTESAEVFNNAAITSDKVALSQIKSQYTANSRDYRSSKNLKIVDDVVSEISRDLKSLFSSYHEPKRINLFEIKNDKKFGIDNNSQVEKLVAINGRKYDESYNDDLKNIATESLIKFKSELEKIQNKEDKKEKKIYWALLSNISAVYYSLGEYDKAIEFAKKRTEIDYNNDRTYNLDIAEKRYNLFEKTKN